MIQVLLQQSSPGIDNTMAAPHCLVLMTKARATESMEDSQKTNNILLANSTGSANALVYKAKLHR